MGATEANKEAEENFVKGLNAAWFALKTLRDHDYDIDMWIDEYTPREAVNEAGKILSEEAETKYGMRVSFEEAWCEKPAEKFVNPLEKRMSYNHPPKQVKPYESVGHMGEILVGCIVFDTILEGYGLVQAIHVPFHNSTDTIVNLSNGHTVWTAKLSDLIATTFYKKTVDDLLDDCERRKKYHSIRGGDVVKILKVPEGCKGIEVGSYQVVADHFEDRYYIYDEANNECEFKENMFELVE